MNDLNSSKKSFEFLLRFKTHLLIQGLVISKDLLKQLEKQGRPLNLGRKAGAGPAGGRYFELPNGSIINVPLYIEPYSDTSLQMHDIDEKNNVRVIDLKKKITILPLKLIETPKFYGSCNSEGISYKKIALIHGKNTFATTIDQRCKYWRTGEQCKFCAIELALKNDDTIERKSPQQILETINAAKNENPQLVNHLTLTIGTTTDADKGIGQYIAIIETIKHQYPTLPIHIQLEPLEDMHLYDQVHEAGADTIGIHLEILDEKIRKEICPGKANLTKEMYYKNWEYAVKIFGENQVSTFILIGLGENISQFKKDLEEVIKRKVIPVITPTRKITGTKLKTVKIDPDLFYELLIYAAKLCKQNGLNPLLNKAGCIKCGGCSPLLEAFELIQ